MLKRLIYLLCSILGGIAIVLVLVFAEASKRKNNGFVRLIPSHTLKGLGFRDVKYNSWSIGGVFEGKLYLSNNLSPRFLMVLDTALKDTLVQRLVFSDTLRLKQGTSVTVQYPEIYLQDPVMAGVLSGKLEQLKADHLQRTPAFTACVPLSPSSFIFRTVRGGKENILMKQSGLKLQYDTTILQKQIDGLFCTDGKLIKVPETDKLVYVYHYRNQFMVLDTNLKLAYRGKTLDTISRAQIKVAELKDKHKLTLASPPAFVNKHVAATKDYLFVQSALKAENDVDEGWEANTVIDVYAIKDGKYKLSLYVPHFKDIKLKDFKVFGNRMYVLYDNYLYRYEIKI